MPLNSPPNSTCDFPFRFQRPYRWEELGPETTQGLRHCEICKKDVYIVSARASFKKHAELGHCLAVRLPKKKRGGNRVILHGEPLQPGNRKAAEIVAVNLRMASLT